MSVKPLYLVNEEGFLIAYAPLTASLDTSNPPEAPEFYAGPLDENGNVTSSDGSILASREAMAASWGGGDYAPTPAMLGADAYFRSPTLTVPKDYYTRAKWSCEYYEEEGMINAFMDRDIASAIKPVEFQFPEDENKAAAKVLKQWRATVNADLGHRGGLDEFNRKLAFTLIKKGMTLTMANWGTIMVDGKPYTVPKTLVNFNPLSVVPDFDPLTGARIYYLKLNSHQADAIKDGTAKGFLQLIPDAASRIVSDIDFIVKRLQGIEYDPTFISGGPFLRLPDEGLYTIYYNGQDNDRWPMPSLTPIMSAIAMKRKLQLADFSVADGMVNMMMIWKFPIGTKPADARKVIDKFVQGGRVQSHAVPAGVELEIVTPPHDVLNSSEKFWQPVSEIFAHFDFPLNSKSRGSGDIDSGPLDMASNAARLNVIRDYVLGHNNFFLEQIPEKNKWNFELSAIMPRIDLANTDAFRAFIQGVFDRGKISTQTYLEATGTSLDRELSRLKKEDDLDLEKWMPIRPTFSQTTATGADGRPPEGGGLPSSGPNDKQTRSTKNRPASSAQGNTTKES